MAVHMAERNKNLWKTLDEICDKFQRELDTTEAYGKMDRKRIGAGEFYNVKFMLEAKKFETSLRQFNIGDNVYVGISTTVTTHDGIRLETLGHTSKLQRGKVSDMIKAYIRAINIISKTKYTDAKLDVQKLVTLGTDLAKLPSAQLTMLEAGVIKLLQQLTMPFDSPNNIEIGIVDNCAGGAMRATRRVTWLSKEETISLMSGCIVAGEDGFLVETSINDKCYYASSKEISPNAGNWLVQCLQDIVGYNGESNGAAASGAASGAAQPVVQTNPIDGRTLTVKELTKKLEEMSRTGSAGTLPVFNDGTWAINFQYCGDSNNGRIWVASNKKNEKMQTIVGVENGAVFSTNANVKIPKYVQEKVLTIYKNVYRKVNL